MKKIVCIAGLVLAGWTGMAQQQKEKQPQAKPLSSLHYTELPLGSIQPEGWLKNQLHIMKNGATGHLDEYYWKIKNDNGWLGGKGDDWEETPYWLDGALPLAYILNDEALKAKVLRFVNWNIENQRPSGFFGPLSKAEREGKTTETSPDNGADWWPRMVMLKVIQQYYSATKDPRVLPFMTKYFRYQLTALKTCPLGKWSEWSTARGGDNLLLIYWLYRQTGDAFLLQLGDLIYQQTTPWTQLFGARNWVMEAAAQQNGDHWMDRHGVNVGMALKLPAVQYQATRNKKQIDSLDTGFRDLMTLHGLPYGMFSADEDLHGNLPMQGTELCAIVETMYSLEEIIPITGNHSYADALEKMTFNALPTQTNDNYTERQYFQVANQVAVKRGVSNFSLPFDRGMNNVFGPYAGYTCCTANMHQGWAKFASHLWYGTPAGGLMAMLYSPNTLNTIIKGKKIKVKEVTTYPFNSEVKFIIDAAAPVKFPMQWRVPSWCKAATVKLNGTLQNIKPVNGIITLDRTWQTGDEVILDFPMQITTTNGGRNSRNIERGPLVYALKVKAEWKRDSLRGEKEFTEGPYDEIIPQSDWNYGLLKKVVDDPARHTTIQTKAVGDDFIWNEANAPIEITTVAKKVTDWVLNGNAVADQPITTRANVYQGRVEEQEHRIVLIPYGCTKLRVVAFPVVK
jgi:hypothetical protein